MGARIFVPYSLLTDSYPLTANRFAIDYRDTFSAAARPTDIQSPHDKNHAGKLSQISYRIHSCSSFMCDGSNIPASVIIPVISSAGVTSKAGFQTFAFL